MRGENGSLGGALVHVVDDRKRVHVGYGNIAGQDLGPTPGFTVFSINASVRPFRNARISAGVDNIFVKTYAEHLSCGGFAIAALETTARVNASGRTVWVKANMKF